MNTLKKSFTLLILIIQFIFVPSCNTNAQNSNISVDEFEKGIKQNDIQLLDVRTPEEFQAGHLANALHANWNNDAEFQLRTKALDKSKPLYVYCLAGGRSAEAMSWLKKNGFKNVYNLQGGINAWQQANKPLEGKSNAKQMSVQEYMSLIPKDKTVLVDVGAKWCPPCKKMKPIIETLKNENYTVLEIDGGEQTSLCKELHITGFPVFIVYKNGIEVSRTEGLTDIDKLKELMK